MLKKFFIAIAISLPFHAVHNAFCSHGYIVLGATSIVIGTALVITYLID